MPGKYLRANPAFVMHYREGHDTLVEVVRPGCWVDLDQGVVVDIPEGFVCDGASVPLQIGGYDKLLQGLVHDYAVRIGAKLRDSETNEERLFEGRREADLLYLGVGLWRGQDEPHALFEFACLRAAGVVNRYWQQHPVEHRYWLD